MNNSNFAPTLSTSVPASGMDTTLCPHGVYAYRLEPTDVSTLR